MRKSPAKPHPLTAQQHRFCELVVAGENQTDAWLQAGYRVSREVARRNAAQALRNPLIAARVAELRKTHTLAALFTRDDKRRILCEMILSPAVSVSAKLRAIELDSKLAGHFEPERVEVNTGAVTLEAIRARALEMAERMGGPIGLARTVETGE